MSQNSKTNGQTNDENKPEHDEKGDSEALLIGEGTPRWLSTRFSNIEPSKMSCGEVFVSVIDGLMLESGFSSSGFLNTSLSFDIRIMRSLSQRKISFDTENNNYQIKYSYLSKQTCTLILIAFQKLAVVNVFIPDLKTISLTFDMTNFVDIEHLPKLKNNAKLSIIFKNALCEMKSCIHLDLPTQYPSHILSMPVEILIFICQYLTTESFFDFAITCKRFYSLFDEESIWKCIARLYLPSRPVGFDKCKDFVVYQKRSAQQRRLLHAMNPYVGHPGYYSFPPDFCSIDHNN